MEGCCKPFIREIASSNDWQLKYGISKNSNIPIFSNTITELDDNKITLLHYLEFYNRIFELDEDKKPNIQIIRNRFLCDEWLRVYMSNMERDRRKINVNKKISSGKATESMVVDF